MARKTQIQVRRDTAANWTAANPTLASGELGAETDTHKVKVGDGATAWNVLAYIGSGAVSPLSTKGDVWGFAATDARIPIGSNNQVLTADPTQALGLKWATLTAVVGAGFTLIFDSTLGGAAAAIDTGANAIPSTFNHLVVLALLRTTEVVGISTANWTINGDTGANYDRQTLRARAAATSSGAVTAANSAAFNYPGSNTAASHFGVSFLAIPAYAQTTAHKLIVEMGGMADTNTANSEAHINAANWRNTAAVNQLTVTAASGNLLAGSRMAVYATG